MSSRPWWVGPFAIILAMMELFFEKKPRATRAWIASA
jgi:hypothetical protein